MTHFSRCCLLSTLISFFVMGSAIAQKPYRVDPRDPLSAEKEKVRRAVVAFEGQLVMRDVVSLTGELGEDRQVEKFFEMVVVVSPNVTTRNDSSGVSATEEKARATKTVLQTDGRRTDPSDTTQTNESNTPPTVVEKRKVQVGRFGMCQVF